MGLQVRQATLQQNADVVSDDGVDARSGVARQNDQGQQKGNHELALQQRFAHTPPGGKLLLLSPRGFFHFVQFETGLLGTA